MTPPPFQFYWTYQQCPACKARLLTTVPLTIQFTQGPLQKLGITCYCVSCNRRYRATNQVRFFTVAWMGPVGQWLWWKTSSLEEISQAG